jgi:hypothetical protein
MVFKNYTATILAPNFPSDQFFSLQYLIILFVKQENWMIGVLALGKTLIVWNLDGANFAN